MPKQVFTLADFSRGLNTDTSPRALEANELSICTNVDPSSKGTTKTSGKFVTGVSYYSYGSLNTPPPAGYGLFVFANDNTITDIGEDDTHGDYQGEFIARADGTTLDILEPQTASDSWTQDVLKASEDRTISTNTPIFYAAEGDLYAGGDFYNKPASFKFHYQQKFNGPALIIKDWIPDFQKRQAPVNGTDMNISESSGSTITGLGSNELNWVIKYGSDNTGNWLNTHSAADGAGNYMEFAGSWLYKGGVNGKEAESDLTELHYGSDNATNSAGAANPMAYNAATHTDATVRIQAWTSAAPSNSVLYDTIYGARLYSRVNGTSEWYLLAEADWEKGIQGSLETEYLPWITGTTSFDTSASGHQATTGLIESPPDLLTYKALNGYSTSDLVTDNTVYYKTAVVANSRAYVGNVSVNGRTYGDRILKSPIFEYDLFTENAYVDVASNDGDQITALAAFGDHMIEFKNDTVYIIDISKELEHLTEARRGAGVRWQAAVVTTVFGVVWVNNNGCYLFDGNEIKQLQFGRISDIDWEANITDNAIIGYDTVNQKIIVLWDSTTSGTGNAYVYALDNNSWHLVNDILSQTYNCSNFVNARDDRLLVGESSVIHYMKTPREEGTTATIDIQTKVFDLGNPENKKNLTEIAVVYKYGHASLDINISTDDGASFTEVGGLTTIAVGPHTEEFDVSTNAAFQGKKTFLIQVEGVADDAFELLSVTLTYRDIGVH